MTTAALLSVQGIPAYAIQQVAGRIRTMRPDLFDQVIRGFVARFKLEHAQDRGLPFAR